MGSAQTDDLPEEKPLVWIGSSRADFEAISEVGAHRLWSGPVRRTIGTQTPDGKTAERFGGAGVLEIVEEDVGKAYRAVYTVRFPDIVYVLHAFQKRARPESRHRRPKLRKSAAG